MANDRVRPRKRKKVCQFCPVGPPVPALPISAS